METFGANPRVFLLQCSEQRTAEFFFVPPSLKIQWHKSKFRERNKNQAAREKKTFV